jgi:16S rRNA (adenine1518-N6/adenine1519-N6)-dimethyltransferase
MSDVNSLPPLREVVESFELHAKRSLGQNFLFDINLTRKIARAAGSLEGVTVVEIGPGPGGLTRALLLEGATAVIAIERDPRCLPALEQIKVVSDERLTFIEGDALATDLAALTAHISGPKRICANLPYNIGTALLVQWLETDVWPPWFDRMTLMFQREVAERIVATPQQRVDYGRLAILCNWRCSTRILFDVPASAFTPPPKVTSSIVELVPRESPLPCNGKLLSLVTHAAFGQRRKMLRQSLKGLGVDANTLLEISKIEPTLRAEEIQVHDFVRLANSLAELRSSSQQNQNHD